MKLETLTSASIFLYVTGTIAGWYIDAESSGGSADDRAPLTTPRIGQTGPQCVLSFWYHMYGSHIGTLSVKLAFLDGTQPTIWSKSGSQGDKWQNSRLVIGSRQLFKVWVWQQLQQIDVNCPKLGLTASEKCVRYHSNVKNSNFLKNLKLCWVENRNVTKEVSENDYQSKPLSRQAPALMGHVR